ncbi:TRAP transporter small permease [Halomonas sp. M20]|uniref:TRAP transporter small permease n=1 Tax=Halomonas sp. M20 TaxID=2763264 RepID=UPI001D0B768D|nr:TRAP transporter small permease [Halomonas sp. M20]
MLTNNNSNLTHFVAKVDNWIGKAEAFVLAWGIIIMATNTIANVIGRYVFSQSIYFSEELNQFLILIVTFFGLGYVTRKGQHIRMSAVYDALSPRVQKIFMIIIATLTGAVMLLLAWYAFEYVQKIARRGQITPALQFPLYLTYIWVIIGFLITGVQYILTVLKNLNFSDTNVYISYSQVDEYEDPETAEILHLYEQDHKLSGAEGERGTRSDKASSDDHGEGRP